MSIQPVTPDTLPPRLQRELKTIQAMVEIYCHSRHSLPPGDLCQECRALLVYARKRLRHCPFQTRKPTCGKCPVHCYKKDMRAQVKEVMRYSGPRMIRHHPILAFMHLLDGLRKTPSLFSPRFSKNDSTD